MRARLGLTCAVVLVAAGCASRSTPAAKPAVAAAVTAPVEPQVALNTAGSGLISLPPAPISVPALPPPDSCGAYELFYLVGKPRTEIPVPVDPTRRRVICTTCPRDSDVRPDRLTIEYDAVTGKVTKLQCQ